MLFTTVLIVLLKFCPDISLIFLRKEENNHTRINTNLLT